MTKSETKRRGVSASTVTIVVLSILLIAALGVGITLAFFTANTTVTGTITLGDPVTISITQGGASAASLTFSDNALPGTVYDQPIAIASPASTTTALLRAKLTLTNSDGASTNVQATTTADWLEGEDDYYYYKGTLAASQSVSFVTAITVPTSLTNTDANKSFSVNVIVEAIQQANNAANSVWTTAPTAWLTEYSPTPSGD